MAAGKTAANAGLDHVFEPVGKGNCCRGWCLQTTFLLSGGTPNAAPEALESVFEGG
jgi:hypothetical protein